MVVGQILSNQELVKLSGQPEEKDRCLQRQLGIDEITLKYVRGIFAGSIERLLRAAEILGERDPKFITEMNLAALISTDWTEPLNQAKKVHYLLKKRYQEERKGFFAELGFKLPYIEFLREEVTGRKLNCLKAREKYKNFEVSPEDIQRNVSLPDLDYETCQLLGGYWGRGSLNLTGGRWRLQLNGGVNDFDFYENWVKEAIRRIHNLEVKVESIPIEEYETKHPRISITSKAVFTWLKYDLGFPTPKENVSLPKIAWNRERKQGFFDGIIAFMGGSLSKRGTLALHDHDLYFIENLRELAKEVGYTPKLERGWFEDRYESYRLYFSPQEVERMNLINPKHLLKSKKGG